MEEQSAEVISEPEPGEKAVAPAAMPEAGAHLQGALGMRQRRACGVVRTDRNGLVIVRLRRMMPISGSGCAHWQSSATG